MRTPFDEGYSNFIGGDGKNPYPPDSEDFKEWKRGYDASYYACACGEYEMMGDQ